MRRFVDEPFSRDSVTSLETFLRAKCRDLMVRARDKETCDFVYDLAADLPLTAISEIMQVPESLRGELLTLGDSVIRAPNPDDRNNALFSLGVFGQNLSETRSGIDAGSGSDSIGGVGRAARPDVREQVPRTRILLPRHIFVKRQAYT